MANDCGVELKKHNVCCMALLISGVKTEFAQKMVEEKGDVTLTLDPNRKILGVSLTIIFENMKLVRVKLSFKITK